MAPDSWVQLAGAVTSGWDSGKQPRQRAIYMEQLPRSRLSWTAGLAHLQPLMEHPTWQLGCSGHKSTPAAAHAPYLVLLKRHGSRDVSSGENASPRASIWDTHSTIPGKCWPWSGLGAGNCQHLYAIN